MSYEQKAINHLKTARELSENTVGVMELAESRKAQIAVALGTALINAVLAVAVAVEGTKTGD